MALETKLIQKLSQNLLMTPQLQQAIKLLQLGRLEYKEAIEKELLENPVLEEIKEGEDGSAPAEGPAFADSGGGNSAGGGDGSEAGAGQGGEVSAQPDGESADQSVKNSPVALEDYLQNFSDFRGSAAPRGSYDFEDRPSLEATLTKTQNLAEYLISQLRMLELPDGDRQVVLHVVGNLNKDGYLCCSYDEIAQECSCSVGDVERVMDIFKTVEPVGVAARNLSECLLIQLETQGLGESLEARIVAKHLDKLERRKYDQIAKIEEVAVEEVYKAVQAIQHLEPRPARQFGDDSARYIVPDIYVYKVGTEYVISLNEDGLPKLRVSPYYFDLLKRDDPDNSANRTYLTERLKAASWLIKSIHQRQHTIYKVTESIVKFQSDFLDHGISRLKPLVLRDVADDIGMHESTVSRVTTNKYVHTPQGVFELKFFFTTGIRTSEGEVSSSSIKDKIKCLIDVETPDRPVSDQEIVEMLKKESINIARRTVAKYREGMGILSSAKRKKLF